MMIFHFHASEPGENVCHSTNRIGGEGGRVDQLYGLLMLDGSNFSASRRCMPSGVNPCAFCASVVPGIVFIFPDVPGRVSFGLGMLVSLECAIHNDDHFHAPL